MHGRKENEKSHQIVPKIGLLQTLSFKVPSPQAEQLFVKSYAATLERYRSLLEEYALGDKTYARLLDELSDLGFRSVTPALRENILAFYSASGPGIASPNDSPRWRKTERELKQLRATEGAKPDARSAAGIGLDGLPVTANH